uniref:Uncharacterized protein n=1 Tax=Trichuris muris TaxID=70415 RepID=A0A5S6Q9I6_TRIMR
MMSVSQTPQNRRRDRGTRNPSGPEAVTEESRSERDDSKATITALADAVASLTRKMGDLQAIVMNMQPSPDETAGTVKPPPGDEHRTNETDNAANKSNRERIIQDAS